MATLEIWLNLVLVPKMISLVNLIAMHFYKIIIMKAKPTTHIQPTGPIYTWEFSNNSSYREKHKQIKNS